MKKNVLLTAVCALWLGHFGYCADPMDSEMANLVERAKSADAETRSVAVRDLLQLREGVSDALAGIVSAGNEGKADPGSKASALYLMGELGLFQCKAIMEREKSWWWEPDPKTMMSLSLNERFRMMGLLSTSSTLTRLGIGNNVSLNPRLGTASLSDYPHLSKALADLLSAERKTRRDAEDSVLRWYEVVCRGMNSVLDPSRGKVYPGEVKATAAFILGEYRTLNPYRLLTNIDLTDAANVCAGYGGRLTAMTAESQHPCAVALVKVSRRANLDGCLTRIATKATLSQETRDRIARVCLAIDEKRTRKLFESKISGLEDATRWAGTEEDRQRDLGLLRSIQPIIRANE